MGNGQRLGTVALVCLALSGCASAYPAKQIGKTGAALGSVQTTFSDYYTGLNAYGREGYIRTQVYRGQPISSADPHLAGSIYPDDAIAVRLEALDMVARYAKLLDAYAKGTEAKDFGEAVGGLSESLFTLQAHVKNASADAEASKYAAPVTSLVSAVATWIIDRKLQSEFKTHVSATTPHVLTVLDLLRADATNILQPTKLIGTHAEFASLVGYYNDHAATLSPGERAAMTTTLIEAAAARDASKNLDLVGVIDSAKKAVIALDKDVNGKATPAETAAAVDEFTARVIKLNEILDTLKAARKD